MKRHKGRQVMHAVNRKFECGKRAGISGGWWVWGLGWVFEARIRKLGMRVLVQELIWEPVSFPKGCQTCASSSIQTDEFPSNVSPMMMRQLPRR